MARQILSGVMLAGAREQKLFGPGDEEMLARVASPEELKHLTEQGVISGFEEAGATLPPVRTLPQLLEALVTVEAVREMQQADPRLSAQPLYERRIERIQRGAAAAISEQQAAETIAETRAEQAKVEGGASPATGE